MHHRLLAGLQAHALSAFKPHPLTVFPSPALSFMQPSTPAQVCFMNCNVKQIVAHEGMIYLARVNASLGCSEIFCPNTEQCLRIEGQVEDMAVRSR
jgi:hypothetical protein